MYTFWRGTILHPTYSTWFTTTWPYKHSRVFLVPCKKWLIQCTIQYTCTSLALSLLTRYQKHTAMNSWSHCIVNISDEPNSYYIRNFDFTLTIKKNGKRLTFYQRQTIILFFDSSGVMVLILEPGLCVHC